MESLIHAGIKCQLCQKFPIIGIRYKCLQCDSYDLCEECEQKFGRNHGHLLLKLRNNKQINMLGNKTIKKEKEIKLKAQPKPRPLSKCLNKKMIFKTVNNNNFINIPVSLMNSGKTNWPWPCYFTCEENVSKIKGEKVKLTNFTGAPGEKVNFNIKLDLSSINKTGNYNSIWCLRDENGVPFGQRFIFLVNDTFKGKLELKPLYRIKEINAVNTETKTITTAEYLAKKGIH